ncbi:MAG: SagB/ThcOx family dehydrogenase [Calditrichaeota bacterium]|nr:SagB/ThcOx family dehydrogenase [Calditrichota bacterium]
MKSFLSWKTARSNRVAGALVGVVLLGMGISGVMGEDKETIGERFHRETALSWTRVLKDVFSRKPPRPPQYKTYPDAEVIELPEPDYRGLTLEEAIRQRRSVREYTRKPLSLEQLSQLLFAAQGITGHAFGQPLRSVPSAGALYPFEIYVIVHRVTGLQPGVYHYAVRQHALEVVKLGDFRRRITHAGLEQDMLGEASVVFVLAAIFDRTRSKYGERGFRYVYMEAGHISQNIYLQAVSLKLGSVCIGAFLDDKVNELIGVDGRKEAAIYLHAVGTRE